MEPKINVKKIEMIAMKKASSNFFFCTASKISITKVENVLRLPNKPTEKNKRYPELNSNILLYEDIIIARKKVDNELTKIVPKYFL